MGVVVVLPGPLAQDAQGRSRVELPARGTVAEVLEALFAGCPRLRQRILTEQGEVRPHVNLFVEHRSIRLTGGLATPVRDGCEVFILPAISGGATPRADTRFTVYLAGPLFSDAERRFLDSSARALRQAGLDCFVPHEHEARLPAVTARAVFELDHDEGLLKANALLAWVDGPTVDDGTACEIGIFWGLMQRGEGWRKGILALATDLRLRRRDASLEHGGLNLFLAGVIERAGGLCWSLAEAVERLQVWKRELDAGT